MRLLGFCLLLSHLVRFFDLSHGLVDTRFDVSDVARVESCSLGFLQNGHFSLSVRLAPLEIVFRRQELHFDVVFYTFFGAIQLFDADRQIVLQVRISDSLQKLLVSIALVVQCAHRVDLLRAVVFRINVQDLLGRQLWRPRAEHGLLGCHSSRLLLDHFLLFLLASPANVGLSETMLLH